MSQIKLNEKMKSNEIKLKVLNIDRFLAFLILFASDN